MSRSLAFIGGPSSAGAYAPGQEKTPAALRSVDLLGLFEARGISCRDLGDVEGFRWRADRANPRAMNAAQVERVARAVAERVEKAVRDGRVALVIGGDCTIELGTLSGLLRVFDDVGLIYFDFDVDMNTPSSTTDGALDWMGVAHMLALPGTLDTLASLGPRTPMIGPDALLLFGAGNVEKCEQEAIDRLGIATVRADDIARDVEAAIEKARAWAGRFDKLLVHLDVDVIDYEDFPLAENTRRKVGLPFEVVMRALQGIASAPNLSGLTICEINPDHGLEDQATLREFTSRLAAAF